MKHLGLLLLVACIASLHVFGEDFTKHTVISKKSNIAINATSTVNNKRTIHVATAGTLQNLISDSEKYTIEELTLTGELNGTDFRLLRDMAGCNYKGERTEGKLTVLDISAVNVVAGGEKYLDTWTVCCIGDYSSFILTGSFYYEVLYDNILPAVV